MEDKSMFEMLRAKIRPDGTIVMTRAEVLVFMKWVERVEKNVEEYAKIATTLEQINQDISHGIHSRLLK